MACQLPAQLASYGTSPSRDKDHLIPYIAHDFVQIDLYGFPSQQVLYLHLFKPGYIYLAIHQLIDTGQILNLASCFLAYAQNVFNIIHRR